MSAEHRRWPVGRLLSLLLAASGAVRAGGLLDAPGAGVPDLLDNPLSVPQLATGDLGTATSPSCRDVPTVEDAQAAPPLSLAEAIGIALCRHPQLAQAQAEIHAQAAALGEARAAYWPRLQGSISRLSTTTLYTGSNQPIGQEATSRSATLSWRLFDFGTRQAGHEGAQRLLAAASAARDATAQRVMAALVSAYFDAITAQAMATMRREAWRQAGVALSTATRREQRGLVAGSDVLQARAQQARAQLALERAEGEARRAQLMLSAAMALPDGTALRLPERLDAPQDEETEDLQRWLVEARERHPAVVAAQARLQSARLRAGSARSEGLPTLDFTASRHVNGQPDQGLYATGSRVTTYGVTLTLPLFEGFARTYRVRGAQAQVEQSEAQLEQARQQVAIDVLRAHADAVSARRLLPGAGTLAEAAEAAAASAVRRYDKGVADITELLSSQSLLAEARLEQLRTLAEWHSARLRLLAAAGVMQAVDGGQTQVSTVP